jgi:hypothetical protein
MDVINEIFDNYIWNCRLLNFLIEYTYEHKHITRVGKQFYFIPKLFKIPVYSKTNHNNIITFSIGGKPFRYPDKSQWGDCELYLQQIIFPDNNNKFFIEFLVNNAETKAKKRKYQLYLFHSHTMYQNELNESKRIESIFKMLLKHYITETDLKEFSNDINIIMQKELINQI